MGCSCFGGKSKAKKYQQKPASDESKKVPIPADKEAQKPEPASIATAIEYKHVPEPILNEITNYVKQRGNIHLYTSLADVRAELLRNVNENIQQVDMYPKGRQMLHDEEYLAVLKDLLNLSNILDDMEMTGTVPYPSRTQYYNLHSKLLRLLVAKTK